MLDFECKEQNRKSLRVGTEGLGFKVQTQAAQNNGVL